MFDIRQYLKVKVVRRKLTIIWFKITINNAKKAVEHLLTIFLDLNEIKLTDSSEDTEKQMINRKLPIAFHSINLTSLPFFSYCQQQSSSYTRFVF